jgi:protein-disulfide isomerase
MLRLVLCSLFSVLCSLFALSCSSPSTPVPAASSDAGEDIVSRKPADPTVWSVDVAGDPFDGPADAKVTLVVATEYACPFCARLGPVFERLRKEYPADLRIAYKQFIVEPDRAGASARAACAAGLQGIDGLLRFDRLLWTIAMKREFGEDRMIALAAEAGLDAARFRADLGGDACRQDIEADAQALRAVGLISAPAVLVNGRLLPGTRTLEEYRTLIDEERAKADAAIARGEATAADYYRKQVVEQGQKTR